METTTFGRTGWEVSRLALGTYFLTSDRRVSHREAIEVIRRARSLGVNVIDTAPMYGRGEAEQLVGEALAGDDGRCRIVDKVGNFDKTILAMIAHDAYRDPWTIRALFEHSLRLLRRDSVDLLEIHEADWLNWWTDMSRAQGPVMDVLDELRDDGLVERIGIAVRDPAAAVALCDTGRFDAMGYVHYFNLVWQEAGETVLPRAAAQQMGIAIGAPFRQGLLIDPDDERLSRLRAEQRADVPPGIIDRIARARDIARESGMSLTELGIRFLIGHPLVDVVFVGAMSVRELEENAEWVERGPLPGDVQQAVDALRSIAVGRWSAPARLGGAARMFPRRVRESVAYRLGRRR